MSSRYARVLVRSRWIVLLLTAVGVGAVLRSPSLESVGGADFESVIPRDVPAITTQEQIVKSFAFPALARVAVVQRVEGSMSPATQLDVVEHAVKVTASSDDPIAGALPVTNSFGLLPSASEDATTAVTFLFFRTGGTDTRIGAAHDYAHEAGGPDAGVVGVTGAVPARVAQGDEITGALPLVEWTSVVLIVVLVGVMFRSVVAPVIALLGCATSYLLATHLLAFLAQHVGLGAPGELEPLIVVLVVGVMTDYTIFYLHEFRTGLRRGLPVDVARRRSIEVTAPVVVTAAATVAGSTGSLAVARLPLFHNVGPGMAVATLISGLVAVTTLPALLAAVGPLSFWPGAPRRDRSTRPHPSGVTSLATRRPFAVAIAILGIAGMSALAWPVGGAHLGVNLIEGLPRGTEAARAADAAARGFAPGIVAPTEIVVSRPRISDRRSDLAVLQDSIERERGVAGVIGPRQQLAPSPLGVVLSSSGSMARFVVVLSHSPYSAAAIEDLQHLRSRLPILLRQAGLGGADYGIAGDTALSAEVVDLASHDLVRIAVTILAVELVILILFLRSLAAPIVVILTSLLVVLVALSVCDQAFATLVGSTSLTFYVPFATAVLLLAFGADYSVYVIGRVWSQSRRQTFDRAVATAGAETAGAITAAGLTLASSFGLLALISLTGFRQLAFAVAFGVLLDTFIVRTLLVPAVLTSLGRWSAWPREMASASISDSG